MRCARSLPLVLGLICSTVMQGSTGGQTDTPSSTENNATATNTPLASGHDSVFHSETRLVMVEVVARDHNGHAVTDLTKREFEISELISGKKQTEEEKIAVFRPVTMSKLASRHESTISVPPGVFTNLLTNREDPIPPTVLLVDGLNTAPADQLQVHRQMVKMLASIPEDAPVAVFLLGQSLTLIQGFTTDPKLLKEAVASTSGANSYTLAQVNPRDDPDAPSAFLENDPIAATILPRVERFEQESYGREMDLRVAKTLDALRSIARHIAGYPGRKNLLWISSSFPIVISPANDFDVNPMNDLDLNAGIEMKDYAPEMLEVATVLGDANIAIYPIDPAGLAVPMPSERAFKPGGAIGAAISREDQLRANQQQAMRLLADETGGRTCVNNNDLGDCVRRAVNDGSSFYEIGYYPYGAAQEGKFHKISVKTSRAGVRLSYRQGYYATVVGALSGRSREDELQRAACADMLTATSIMLGAKVVPSDSTGTTKYALVIDPNALTPIVSPTGVYQLDLRVAACTFDKTAKPLMFRQMPLKRTLTPAQYASARNQHGLLVAFTSPQELDAVGARLVIADTVSGRLGSVNVLFTQPSSLQKASPK